MKHVVVLNQYALPRTESGGTRHVDLFGRIDGWTPLIVAGNRNHYSQRAYTSDDDRFRLLNVPTQFGSPLSRLFGWIVYAIQAFAVTLTRKELDLVFGSSPQPLAPLAGLLAARLRGVPFILEVRDLWPESAVAAGKLSEDSFSWCIFSWLERFLSTRAMKIACVTGGWEDHFANLGVRPEDLVVIPNGTEPPDFKVIPPRQALRTHHSIEGFTAVFAGAHGPKDGLDLILDAARTLPGMNFLMVGAGPSKAEAVGRAKLEAIRNVRFHEPVPKTALIELLYCCDVGVHAVSRIPVFEKGMSPNKLFDYMAARLPIVSNAASGLARIIKDGECGRVGDWDSLATGLKAVQDATDEQREVWSIHAADIVRIGFSRTSAAKVLKGLLDDVTASSGSIGSSK